MISLVSLTNYEQRKRPAVRVGSGYARAALTFRGERRDRWVPLGTEYNDRL